MPRTVTKSSEPEEQLQSFIEKFEPPHQAIIRAARKKLRKRFPTATELVYDNYNFFVIAFGPNERPSDCIVTIAAASNGVGLCFVRGASLPDPGKVLLGSGKDALCSSSFSGRSRPASRSEIAFSGCRACAHSTSSDWSRKTCDSIGVIEAATPPQTAEGLTSDAANRGPPLCLAFNCYVNVTSSSPALTDLLSR